MTSSFPKPAVLSKRVAWHFTWAFFALHVLWLCVRYSLSFPLWGDEAFVVNNFRGVGYSDLFHPLPNGQIAPLLWIWVEKFCFDFFGDSVASLRLPAFLAGLLSTGLMLRLCRKTLSPTPALIAFGIFAASYYPLRHAAEIKPYSTDLLFALAELSLAIEIIKRPQQNKWLPFFLFTLSFVGVWASYPSLFVSAGIALVFFTNKETRSIAVVGSTLLGLVTLWMTFSYAIPHAHAAAWLVDLKMWKDSFPPIDSIWLTPYWWLKQHCGYMSAYPTGGRDWGSSLSFLLVLLGAISWWKEKNRTVFFILIAPLFFNFIAAAFEKYPYGGSARISLFMAPAFCLFMGQGVSYATVKMKRKKAVFAITFLLSLLALLTASGVVRDIQKPYKSLGDVAAFHFSKEIQLTLPPGIVVTGFCRQKNQRADLSALGGSFARLRAQLERQNIHVDWSGRVERPLLAEQWWISYTDNHVSATQQILREQLDLAKSIGMKIEHFPFPFDKKERVDVYHIYAVKRVGFE